jgi:hypothetical protein
VRHINYLFFYSRLVGFVAISQHETFGLAVGIGATVTPFPGGTVSRFSDVLAPQSGQTISR